MAKKKTYIPKKVEPTPVEEPWIVVGAPGTFRAGKPIYQPSPMGIDEERARQLAGRLEGAIAVPAQSLSNCL